MRKDEGINNFLLRPAQLAYEFQPRSCPHRLLFLHTDTPRLTQLLRSGKPSANRILRQ